MAGEAPLACHLSRHRSPIEAGEIGTNHPNYLDSLRDKPQYTWLLMAAITSHFLVGRFCPGSVISRMAKATERWLGGKSKESIEKDYRKADNKDKNNFFRQFFASLF